MNGAERWVVVAGGGYSGVLAANRAQGKLRGRARVVLITPGDTLTERIRLHETAARGTDVRRPYSALLARGIEHIDGRVIGLEPVTNTLRFTRGSGRGSDELCYAALVLACGSRLAQTIPSRSAHADALCNVERAQHLAARLPGLARGARVLVVGGGLTAIELSAELAETHPQLQVELLAREFAPGLGGTVGAALRQGLAELNVRLREGVEVSALDETGAQLADGTRIDAAISVLAAGMEAEPLAAEMNLSVGNAGRLSVTSQLLAAGTGNVFVIGDLAAPPLAASGPARTTRMACATALPLGAHAGDQVARLLAGEALLPYRFGYVLQCISLGRRSGVIVFVDADDQPTGHIITGRSAALIKEMICRFAIGSLKLERLLAGAYAWSQPARAATRGALPT
jgi:NADH dehydrogenase